MSKGNSKIEFKRMLRQYEFLLEDLADLKELSSEINSEFNSRIAELKRPDIFESRAIKDAAEESEEEDVKSQVNDKSFKKLFRKIVVKCHPDKMESDISTKEKAIRIDLYNQATKANDTENWALLITIAIKLEIELNEEHFEHVEKIQQEADKIKEEIDNIQGSIAWTWYHAPDDNKDIILNSYVKHMEKAILGSVKQKKLILGLGHPRTGTGFTANLLQSWGLDVGHEIVGKDGIVAWQLAIKEGPWQYMKDHKAIEHDLLIYNVRDPKTSIASIVFTEDVKPQSLKWRLKRGGVIPSTNKVEQSINSILRWDKLISRMDPDFIYRIEDQHEDLFNFLKNEKGLDIEYQAPSGKINARNHDSLEELKSDFNSVRPSVRNKINEYCLKYGYDTLF